MHRALSVCFLTHLVDSVNSDTLVDSSISDTLVDSINSDTINDNVVTAFLARCSHSDTLIDVCAHALRNGISFQRIVDTATRAGAVAEDGDTRTGTAAEDGDTRTGTVAEDAGVARCRENTVRRSASDDVGLDSHYLMGGRKAIAEFLVQLGRQHSLAHARLGVAFVIQGTRDGIIPASRYVAS